MSVKIKFHIQLLPKHKTFKYGVWFPVRNHQSCHDVNFKCSIRTEPNITEFYKANHGINALSAKSHVFGLAQHFMCQSTPLMTSFRRMFYAYHHAMKHHHTNIILSLFSIHFGLKCATNNLNISSSIKTIISKNKFC